MMSLHHRPTRQRGAAAIEFALIFTIFFGVLYGIFSYAFVMLLQQGLTQAAAEGARAIRKVDRLNFTNDTTYQTGASKLADLSAKAALSWLPNNIATRITVVTTWQTVTETVLSGTTGKSIGIPTSRITVVVTYPDYAKAPLLPIMILPGLGAIPQTPKDLIGKATS